MQIHRAVASRLAVLSVACSMISACATTHYRPVSDSPVRIGKPYSVRGNTYVPAADPKYDMLGFASWYDEGSGKQTANGERFRAKAIGGAHRTLPLPSYVEVTSLDTGKSILVRINDRGPFGTEWRIIDLSQGAATLLGIRAQGIAPVRVRVVDPSEEDRARLREGKAARDLPSLSAEALASFRARLKAGCAQDPAAPKGC